MKPCLNGFYLSITCNDENTIKCTFHLHQWRWKFIKHVLISMRVKDLIIEFLSPTEMKTMKMSFHLYQWRWKLIEHVLISVRVGDLIIEFLSPTEIIWSSPEKSKFIIYAEMSSVKQLIQKWVHLCLYMEMKIHKTCFYLYSR